ncbi:RecB family exonuclease [Patescibacteria group bacterium]
MNEAPDKFEAVWVSHSSISDFLRCPRAYFLKNVYKEPISGRKVSLITPALALGQIVHSLLESLSVLPLDKRFEVSLLDRFDQLWPKIAGEKGGFRSISQEKRFFKRGKEMIRRVVKDPGPLGKLAVKIKKELPYFWLSEEENLILCGKIDWLEYLPETDSVHIIDFKTGQSQEKEDSLQLPIYALLVKNCQERKISKVSYWYLRRNDLPTKQPLPGLAESQARILKTAKKIKLARQLEKFICPEGSDGCRWCLPFEKIIAGEGILVGTNDFGHSVYILKKPLEKTGPESEIL